MHSSLAFFQTYLNIRHCCSEAPVSYETHGMHCSVLVALIVLDSHTLCLCDNIACEGANCSVREGELNSANIYLDFIAKTVYKRETRRCLRKHAEIC